MNNSSHDFGHGLIDDLKCLDPPMPFLSYRLYDIDRILGLGSTDFILHVCLKIVSAMITSRFQTAQECFWLVLNITFGKIILRYTFQN